MTATVSSTSYDWVGQADLNVLQGVIYRFVILAPAGSTQDAVYDALCGSTDPASCTKWDITSIGAPPASVVAGLQTVLAQFPAASPPVAFYVIATWLQANATLAQPDGQLYYEGLAYYATIEGAPVPAPNVNDPSGAPSSTTTPWLTLLLGAAAVGGAYFLATRDEAGFEHARANPVVQSITSSVNGRKTIFEIATDGPTWTATTTLRGAGVRKKQIMGSGSSKSEALQSAIALASAAYANADVRA